MCFACGFPPYLSELASCLGPNPVQFGRELNKTKDLAVEIIG